MMPGGRRLFKGVKYQHSSDEWLWLWLCWAGWAATARSDSRQWESKFLGRCFSLVLYWTRHALISFQVSSLYTFEKKIRHLTCSGMYLGWRINVCVCTCVHLSRHNPQSVILLPDSWALPCSVYGLCWRWGYRTSWMVLWFLARNTVPCAEVQGKGLDPTLNCRAWSGGSVSCHKDGCVEVPRTDAHTCFLQETSAAFLDVFTILGYSAKLRIYQLIISNSTGSDVWLPATPSETETSPAWVCRGSQHSCNDSAAPGCRAHPHVYCWRLHLGNVCASCREGMMRICSNIVMESLNLKCKRGWSEGCLQSWHHCTPVPGSLHYF